MVVNVDADYLKEIEKTRRYLRALISSRNCAPLMLRLANLSGGPNGSIRFKEELNRPHNTEEVKAKHPRISYADLYQLAGIVEAEITGGPSIPFTPGRKDADSRTKKNFQIPIKVSPAAQGSCNGILFHKLTKPSFCNTAGASHLRTLFSRMGLSDRDIVALSGGHTLGRAHKERSNFEGPWTQDPLKFDNSYFVELLKGETPGLLQLKTDKALLDDPMLLPFVKLYAKDKDTFFRAYAISHKKLSELGVCPLRKVSSAVTQQMVGIAVAAAMVIFTICYEASKRGK